MSDQELDELLYQYAPQIRELQLSTVPRQEDLPKYQTSPRFKRRMARLIRRSKRPAWLNSVLHYTYQAAVIALVVTTVSFSGLMITSQAFRQQVISAVIEVFEVFTEFRFQYDDSQTVQRTAGDFVLTYLPKDMVEIDREEDSTSCYIFFENDSGDTLRVMQEILTEKNVHTYGLDTEDAEVHYFTIGSSQAIAVSKKETQTILWSEGNSVFNMRSTISMDELKQIAMGLK